MGFHGESLKHKCAPELLPSSEGGGEEGGGGGGGGVCVSRWTSVLVDGVQIDACACERRRAICRQV